MSQLSKQRVNTCVKLAKAFSYSLPVQIENSIIQYLTPFAKPTWSFKNTRILGMDGPKFKIDGIADTHVLTITVKKDATQQDVEALEKALESYINSQKG